MGTPRETLRLVRAADATVRMVTTRTGDRSHRRDGRLVQAAGLSELDRAGSLRLHPQEGLAELRDGAREGLRRHRACPSGTDADSSPRRCCRDSPTCRSKRRGGSPIRGCARTSSSGCSPISVCSGLFAGRWTVGASGAVPHRAQDVAALALDDSLPRARPARRGRCARCRARCFARTYESRFMATMALIATAAPPHQRADAHGRASQEAARCGVEARAAGVASTSTAASSCRWSCR